MWTFGEGERTLRRIRYRQPPEGVFLGSGTGQKCVSSPMAGRRVRADRCVVALPGSDPRAGGGDPDDAVGPQPWRPRKVLVPGVVSHATNVVEHPEVVAGRQEEIGCAADGAPYVISALMRQGAIRVIARCGSSHPATSGEEMP
jgi:hypothetical protein